MNGWGVSRAEALRDRALSGTLRALPWVAPRKTSCFPTARTASRSRSASASCRAVHECKLAQ